MNPPIAVPLSNPHVSSNAFHAEADLIELFKKPSSKFRGKPFWSWNGKLEREELLRQVHVFKEMGMGGFFMHSRTGLQTEYLGSEWFELINACADEAEKLGLEAWLYDEDRWPSGSAGGLATADPRYRLQSLRLTLVPVSKFKWPSEFVAVFQARMEGLNAYECQRLQPGQLPDEDAGEQILIFTTETTQPHTFYNGNTYLDTLKREATEHFISLTHEKYRQHCGSRLGRSIHGIFTDEPHHGMVMCHNTETRQHEEPEWTTPFTDALFEEFTSRFGYDLRARLPELFLLVDGHRISQVKWHYMELIQQLFLENWAKPLHDWCREHNLKLTGHVLHEDTLAAQAVPCGSLMRYYEFLDYPGVDVLGNDNRNFCIVKQLASAARQFGKPWMLSELYGCSGWQLDFAGHKQIGAWQALYGINLRCHHLAWYTMAGEAKRDYPASIFFQSAWHPQYSAVEDYFSRLHILLQRGSPVCDVLVLNPVESLWAQIHAGWATWLCAKNTAVELIEDRYRRLFTWLSRAHVDFDYGDEDHIARFGSVEGASDGNPLLRIGHGKYRVVIVAGMETIRSTTLAVLQRFKTGGGTVIFAGPEPMFVDALPSKAAKKLAEQSECVAFREEAILSKICAASQVPVRIAQGQPDAATDLLCQVRREGETWFIVILNTSKCTAHQSVEIRFCGNAVVEEWDCATGEQFSQTIYQRDGSLLWHTDLPPLGERIFVVKNEHAVPLPKRLCRQREETIALTGPFKFALNEPNICVLDFAQYRLGNAAWSAPAEILKIDQSVRDTLKFPQRSGAMLQPWAREKAPASNGSVPGTRLGLRFAFEIEILPSGPVELMIETPAAFQIQCNGHSIQCPAAPEWLIDPCFKRIRFPEGALMLGINTIELEVDFSDGIALEAIYLLGAFGVTLRSPVPILGALPARLTPGDASTQGLPFYSGCISYHIPAGRIAKGRPAWLETGLFGGAALMVRTAASGNNGTIITWPPYEANVTTLLAETDELICDVWLTRRNTFGPLHLLPKKQSHIGPDSFRSSGAAFCEAYQLYPSGLLQIPKLHIGAAIARPALESISRAPVLAQTT
ncbi:MAG: hypothetical protein JWL59_486 [Chthoniobacteraceae bacterium]|nr:hypothetical protein [Chthoniobacteraceae bacterium]